MGDWHGLQSAQARKLVVRFPALDLEALRGPVACPTARPRNIVTSVVFLEIVLPKVLVKYLKLIYGRICRYLRRQ
jgi:hypothetical protein